MTTSTDWTTNGAEFLNRASSAATAAATKAVADTVVKTATENTAKASQAAVKSATAAVETAHKAVKTMTENNAAATTALATAFGKATTAVAQLTTPTPGAATVSFETVNRQIEQAVQALAAQGKQAGTAWLDAYDKGFAAFLQLRLDLAAATQVEAVKTLADNNSKALEQLNTAYTAAIRDLLQ
jgi:protein-tyrosine-phosphatase